MPPSKAIRIADDLTLPIEIVTESLGILGKRRVGKSNVAAVIAEQLFKAKQQLVIIDPKGDWWGLRHSFDGKGPGLPILILGGEHGDLPLHVEAREEIARFVVESGTSVILDLSQFRKFEIARFMGGASPPQKGEPDGFLEALYRLKAKEQYRTALLVIIDEADAIAPMKPQKGEERMLGATDDIVRRGGQRGLGSLLATQRPAVLHTNIRTQMQVVLALRTIGHHDVDAIGDWIDAHVSKAMRGELIGSLGKLAVGDGWVWSPGWPDEAGIFKRVSFHRRTTFDSGATPKPGERRVQPGMPAKVQLEALEEQFAEAARKLKEDSPTELKKTIAERDRAIRDLERRLATVKPEVKVETVKEIERVEVPAIAPDIITRFESAVAQLLELGVTISEGLKAAAESSAKYARTIPAQVGSSNPGNNVTAVSTRLAPPPAPTPARRERELGRNVITAKLPTRTEGVSGPQQRILDALAAFAGLGLDTVDRRVVAAWSKQSPRSSGFEKNISTLRTAQLIDYPGAGLVALTPAGSKAANHDSTPLTSRELHEAWIRLVSGPQGRMLRALIDHYPGVLTREQLATMTDQSIRSSGFEKNVSTLRSLGLLEYPQRGETVATDLLFPEGLR